MGKENVRFEEYVGSRIKFFRKVKGISLDELAEAVHRSKSTLSKYENGVIPISVDILYEIANVLQVKVCELVEGAVQKNEEKTFIYSNPFHGLESVYLYYFDGRTNRVVETRLALQHEHAQQNQIPCECYMDIPSSEEYTKCKFYYKGMVTFFDLFTYVTLDNQLNRMEQINICVLNAFHSNQDSLGFMTGVSYNPITPSVIKCLFSMHPLVDKESHKESMMISKNEIKMIKNMNMLFLDAKRL